MHFKCYALTAFDFPHFFFGSFDFAEVTRCSQELSVVVIILVVIDIVADESFWPKILENLPSNLTNWSLVM